MRFTSTSTRRLKPRIPSFSLSLRAHPVLTTPLALAGLALLAYGQGTTRIHVAEPAPPGGTGASWASPVTLTAALSMASSGDEIWVRQGTYSPGPLVTSTFSLAAGLEVYGGFEGTETTLVQRKLLYHDTVLSGDVAGNDVCDSSMNRSDNNRHVVTASGSTIGPDTLLDGFTIRGGTGGAFGGGLHVSTGADPTIRNCTFVDNQAGKGGGAGSEDSSPRFEDCVFDRNHATSWGGGAYVSNGAPLFLRCTFYDNVAPHGGGLWTRNVSLIACDFRRNEAARGGGVYLNNGSRTLVNTMLARNRSTDLGGGAYVHDATITARFVNCTVAYNTSVGGAGGIDLGSTTPLGADVDNSILFGNVGDPVLSIERQQYRHPSDAGTIDYTFLQGWTGLIGGMQNFGDTGTPDFTGELMAIGTTSPCIDQGDAFSLPADVHDLDDDGNVTELMPLDLSGRPRMNSVPGVPSPPLVVQSVDLGAYEWHPVPTPGVAPVPCFDNPGGSLRILFRDATTNAITFALNNPLGTQGIGSAGALAASLPPGGTPSSLPGGPCIPIPGFGMASSGAAGGLFVNLPTPWIVLGSMPWLGCDRPARATVSVPSTAVGLTLVVQGLLVDGSFVDTGLTEALEVTF